MGLLVLDPDLHGLNDLGSEEVAAVPLRSDEIDSAADRSRSDALGLAHRLGPHGQASLHPPQMLVAARRLTPEGPVGSARDDINRLEVTWFLVAQSCPFGCLRRRPRERRTIDTANFIAPLS